MRLRAIVCEVLAPEVNHLAALVEPTVDVTLLTQGLHDLGPERMQERLQHEIDSTDAGRYDAVALGYALCSRGAEGIVARELPVAIPRAHDCITLLLGSRERYARESELHPGTYYWSAGWNGVNQKDLTPAGPGVPQDMGTDLSYEQYVEQYGEDNARYIVEQLRGGLNHYDRLLFVESGLGGEEEARRTGRERAEREGWKFEVTMGDLSLLRRLLSGDWDEDFVVLRPGERLVMTYDAQIMERELCPSV